MSESQDPDTLVLCPLNTALGQHSEWVVGVDACLSVSDVGPSNVGPLQTWAAASLDGVDQSAD